MANFARNSKMLFGLLVTNIGVLCCTLPSRKMYLKILKFFGKIGLFFFPQIYSKMDQFNQTYSSSKRVKEKYQDKAAIRQFLMKSERKKLSDEKILAGIKSIIGEEVGSQFNIHEIFENADPNCEVAIQFSGGCDSTLIAILAAQYFKKVHLLNFTHSLIANEQKSDLNANKLLSIFGTKKIVFRRIDTTKIYDHFLFGSYQKDLEKYGNFIIGLGCLACKLSFDVSIIKYALENNLKFILDGADLSVKTQLSQGNETILNERLKLYRQYGLEFMHPAVKFKNNAYLMLKLGLELKPRTIFFAEQPECKGNQFLNEIHDRFYFIPKYGVDLHTKKAFDWLIDKLDFCHDLIQASKKSNKKPNDIQSA